MKSIKYLLTILVFFLSIVTVNASTITKASYSDAVKLEGTGTGTIQIVLFDKDNNPMYMTTVQAVDGKFSVTLPEIAGLENGDYTVKTADYNGASTDSEVVKVQKSESVTTTKEAETTTKKVETTIAENKNNPKTFDAISNSIILVSLAGVGIVASIVYLKITNKKKKEM